jgi:hypothetical protein
MSDFTPFAALAVASTAFFTFYQLSNTQTRKEKYNDQVIMARPNYLPSLTPRFDSNANSGIIRGSGPTDINQTAIRQYPLTQDRLSVSQSENVNEQYNIKTEIKNAPIKKENEYFSEKIKISSMNNNKTNMSQMFEQIDPFELKSGDFSKVVESNTPSKQATSSRPDLSYVGASLPKLGIDNKFKDPTDPTNYMYDRTLFAPLKRRYGNVQTDHIRGDIYVAPNKFGWFDVPSNPGTDLNPGFFNLNYPSFQSHVENQDLKVERQNRSLTMADLESIQKNNPFSTNFQHRP